MSDPGPIDNPEDARRRILRALDDIPDEYGYDDGPPSAVPPALLIELVAKANPDLTEQEVWYQAAQAADALNAERRRRIVRRVADDAEAASVMNLDPGRAVTATEFLAQTSLPPRPCLGGLLSEGHNGLLAAQYKTGKSTLVENICSALTTAVPFLGLFDVPHPYRVVFMNYEMTEDDCRDRLRALPLDTDQLLVLNLRGSNLSLTAPAGRSWLNQRVEDFGGADVILMDTYSAASAPSVDSENDNAGGRRFLLAWDALKTELGIHTSIVTHHTGRGEQIEGQEHGRGATVLDDWADVRILLTRERQKDRRFLASEGRSPYQLAESPLHFDAETRQLLIVEGSLGESRQRVRAAENAALVSRLVRERPGMNTTDLRTALGEAGIAKGEDKSAAITKATTTNVIHQHRDGHSVRHHPGGGHPDTEPCETAPKEAA